MVFDVSSMTRFAYITSAKLFLFQQSTSDVNDLAYIFDSVPQDDSVLYPR